MADDTSLFWHTALTGADDTLLATRSMRKKEEEKEGGEATKPRTTPRSAGRQPMKQLNFSSANSAESTPTIVTANKRPTPQQRSQSSIERCEDRAEKQLRFNNNMIKIMINSIVFVYANHYLVMNGLEQTPNCQVNCLQRVPWFCPKELLTLWGNCWGRA